MFNMVNFQIFFTSFIKALVLWIAPSIFTSHMKCICISTISIQYILSLEHNFLLSGNNSYTILAVLIRKTSNVWNDFIGCFFRSTTHWSHKCLVGEINAVTKVSIRLFFIIFLFLFQFIYTSVLPTVYKRICKTTSVVVVVFNFYLLIPK